MAKILYSVAGEGMGHATRSKAIIDELIKRHEVIITTDGGAFAYLSRHFPSVFKICCFRLHYVKNRVALLGTIFMNLRNLPGFVKNIFVFGGIVRDFGPDVIITDFEPFANYAGLLAGIPTISLDNENVLTRCKIKFPARYYFDFLLSFLVVKLFIIRARFYLITSFFYPAAKGGNVFLYPPVLRGELRRLKPEKGDFILAYQTSRNYDDLIHVLRGLKERFVIYCCSKKIQDENIETRDFCESEFFKDLARCKAVITNGGFSLITEALYLGKPLLCVPVKRQFEQIFNAINVERLGYGKFCENLNEQVVADFVSRLETYEENLKNFEREDNSRIVLKIEELIQSFVKKESAPGMREWVKSVGRFLKKEARALVPGRD